VKPLWFIFLILTTRVLGPEDFGKFMYAVSLIGLVLSFFEFGIAIHTTKTISSRSEDNRQFISQTFGLRIASYVLTVVVFITLYSITTLLEHEIIVYTLLLYGFSNSLTLFYRSVFRGFEKLKYEGLSIIVDRIIVILLCGTVLLIEPELSNFIFAYSVSFFLSMCFTYFLFTKITDNPLPSFDVNYIRHKVIVPGSVFALMNVLLIVRNSIPSIFLETFQSSIQVGFYNSGYRLIESYLLLPSIFVVPIYPYLVRIFARKKVLNKILNNTTRIIFQLTTLIVVPIILFQNEFTILLYGSEYSEASSTVAFLIGGLYFMSLTVIYGSLVTASNKQPIANKFIIIEVVISILIYYWVCTHFSSQGVAMTKLIFEFLMALLLIYTAKNLVDFKLFFSTLIKFFSLVVLTIVSFYLLNSLSVTFHLGVQIAFIYLVLIINSFIFKTLTLDDLRAVKRKLYNRF
jgi:O-antigen/teichoic acid export membrane protein